MEILQRMANYIKNPITNPDWNPSMGDYFNRRVHEEDLLYEKRQKNKKLMIFSLILFHLIGIASISLFY
ncbi:MAG: hypothetical protein CR986_00580 [Ignavibacteriae bacterium]|nr:MAG: hypothetical protein CR986_00580 [Ignavibacteriota bacterium]